MPIRTSLNVTGNLTSNVVSSNVIFANTFCYANGTSIISAPFTTGKAIAMSIVFGG